jgi:hypothetical protein
MIHAAPEKALHVADKYSKKSSYIYDSTYGVTVLPQSDYDLRIDCWSRQVPRKTNKFFSLNGLRRNVEKMLEFQKTNRNLIHKGLKRPMSSCVPYPWL